MSEETPSTNPSEGSIPPVEPIVSDDTDATPAAPTPAPEVPVAEAPVAEVPTASTPATAPAAPEPAPVAAASAPEGHPSSHVLLPKWVVFGVVGVALACLGFGVGWIAKPHSDSTSQPAAAVQPFNGNSSNGNPFDSGNGNGSNGNNGGSNGGNTGNPFDNGNGNGSNGNNGGSNGGNTGNPFDNGNGNGSNGGNGGSQANGAFLGVSATATTGTDKGAEISQVVSDSPADKAGLVSGDVVTKVDDTTITSPEDLVQAIGSHDSGDTVTVTYTHDGDTKTADVTLGDRSDAPSQAPSTPSGTED